MHRFLLSCIFSILQLCGQELIPDRHFEKGFILWDPKPGQHLRYGTFNPAGPERNPSWGLAQWSSRFPLDPATQISMSDGSVVLSNVAKCVKVRGRSGTGSDLSLKVDSSAEYGTAARSVEQPWVHLLLEQDFKDSPFLNQISAARFHLEARLLRSTNLHRGDYNPGLHAAQFQVFFTVQNRRRESPGFGDFLWFGIPVYDSRHRHPPEFKSQDFGGTGKFIFTPAGTTFTEQTAHERRWVIVDRDLLPLMHEALQMAWAKGFLAGSRRPEDYAIGGMNLGWELPGTFAVELEIQNLSLVLDHPNAVKQ